MTFEIRSITLVAASVVALACHPIRQPAADALPRDAFWSSITALCGQAFAGTVIESNPPDTVMRRAALVMHVRGCSAAELRIPFHVDSNRSRTWVLTRTGSGMRLKHDHRHADGTEDAVTQYGGDTRNVSSASRQDFHADSVTAIVAPAARTNVWTMEIVPGQRFTYALRREGSDRRFRVDFDLTRPIAPPPPPWGAR